MKIKNTVLKIIKGKPINQDLPSTRKASLKTVEAGIRRTLADALKRAEGLHKKSIVFSVASGKEQGFPSEGVAKIMAQEIWRFLRDPASLTEITLCLEDDQALKVFEKNVYGYLDHLLNTLSLGPYVTVDVIIELKEGIILIERLNPPYGWALPGGFVDYGETLEEAVIREAKEETHMRLVNLRQFHTYSDPRRDPRFHTIGTVFIAWGRGTPCSGDDAKNLKVVPYRDLFKLDCAFDHKKIIVDYLKQRSG